MISSKLHLMGKQHRRIKATIESLTMVHNKTLYQKENNKADRKFTGSVCLWKDSSLDLRTAAVSSLR